MFAKNFDDWKNAVSAEYDKLRSVRRYLNPDGLDRLKAFAALDDLAAWADSAGELLSFFDGKDMMTDAERSIFCDGSGWRDPLRGAMRRLEKIRKTENDGGAASAPEKSSPDVNKSVDNDAIMR